MHFFVSSANSEILDSNFSSPCNSCSYMKESFTFFYYVWNSRELRERFRHFRRPGDFAFMRVNSIVSRLSAYDCRCFESNDCSLVQVELSQNTTHFSSYSSDFMSLHYFACPYNINVLHIIKIIYCFMQFGLLLSISIRVCSKLMQK